jgi:hypothetical protein
MRPSEIVPQAPATSSSARVSDASPAPLDELADLKRRVAQLEATVDKLCRTAAREHAWMDDRVRELELAFP